MKISKYTLQKTKSQASAGVHYSIVFDRSGSMWSSIDKMIEDLKKQIRSLRVGDALSFGYFASEGQFGFPIKAFGIVNEESFNQLDRMLDTQKSTLGCTCFSEILEQYSSYMSETEFLQLPNVMLFLSDGWANDPSSSSEKASVRTILPQLAEKVSVFVTVPYGNYADQPFLNEMAELAGGECISSSNLSSFSKLVDEFIRQGQSAGTKSIVNIDSSNALAVFSLGDGAVNIHPIADEVVTANDVYVVEDGDGNLSEQEAYATALVFARKGQVDVAMEVVDKLGDVAVVQALDSAMTPAERGSAEDLLKAAVFNPSARYTAGKVPGTLPDPNAFCLLDLVDVLVEDSQAFFYPRHKSFEYNRITRGGKTREGYPKFNAYLDNKSPISAFVWNDSALNLSIRSVTKGTVVVPETFPSETGQVNRPSSVPAIVEAVKYNNYTLIADGFANVSSLPITCSAETERLLLEKGLVKETDGEIVVVDLTKLRVVNKAKVNKPLAAKDLLELVAKELKLTAQIKVYNSLRKELAPDAPKGNKYNEEQLKYLKLVGLREDGSGLSYGPPVDKDPPTDYYEPIEFTLKFKGLSSIPSLNDVRGKLTSGKSLTAGQALMAPVLSDFEDTTKSLSVEQKVSWLDSQTAILKAKLKEVRTEIQLPKFALVLGKKWFTDLPESEAEQTVVYNSTEFGNEVTGIIRVRRTRVDI